MLKPLNAESCQLLNDLASVADQARVAVHRTAGALVIDAGVQATGSLEAGIVAARVCMGNAATISLGSADERRFGVDTAVRVQTDRPLEACLGCQYAGWPVQAEKFFAMGSGPMRLARGREAVLEEFQLLDQPDQVAGLLECTELPSAEVIKVIAAETKLSAERLHLLVAPAGSLVGSLQVVARSIETAMHKLHALHFPVQSVFSAIGEAPLPPPCKPSDVVGGIGRTNDAMLYGARVTLWVDTDQSLIDQVIAQVPSNSSSDYGRPFAEIFRDCGYDFYKIDPHLFSPAMITIVNRRTGQLRRSGQIQTEILSQSFGLASCGDC